MSPYDPQRSRHRPVPADHPEEPAPVDALLGPPDEEPAEPAEAPGSPTVGVDGSALGAEQAAAPAAAIDPEAVAHRAVEGGVAEPIDGEPLAADGVGPSEAPEGVPAVETEPVPVPPEPPRVAPGSSQPVRRRSPVPVAALVALVALVALLVALRRRRDR
jgi:hypothetical protein